MKRQQNEIRSDIREKPSSISIRWKLAIYMAVFVLVILGITWLFQVFLLDTFFQKVKQNEMRETAIELSEKLESDDLKLTAYRVAMDHSLCVVVYKIDPNGVAQIVNVDATGGNVIVSFDNNRLGQFYLRALRNNGSFFTQFAFGGYEIDNNFDMNLFFDRFHFNDENGNPVHVPPQNVRMVYFQIEKQDENTRYMILLDASLQPLDSTVRTLTMQFVWIAAIIMLLSSIMVYFLYRHISRPLIQMNESAKILAKGRYDVEFSGKGYLETRELAATLNYASTELSRLDRLQKDLIANISHDLRTPLTLIKGYGEVMRDLPGENTPENMQVIIDETTRLSELVNDLLDLSRIQSGATGLNLTPFNLSAAIREVLNRYDRLIKHRGYHITVQADAEAWIYADRGMLLQVIYNLINNAINYTGEDKRVEVIQTVSEGTVRISVRDTGEGIAPEEMPLIWDRYYKVDKVHRMAMIGTGLGLSIVKAILENHHAAYGVNSQIGVGSTFWFELPLTEPQDPINQIAEKQED